MRPEDLTTKTREYWDGCRRNGEAECSRRYREELLPLEMETASARQAMPPDSRRGGLLVLMLGFSVEPLLQSILAYRPKEVLVVYARRYDTARETDQQEVLGVEQFSRFQKLVTSLCGQPWAAAYLNGFDPQSHVHKPPTRGSGADTPVEVFDAVRGWVIPKLKQDAKLRERIIIDITGAKKSMVTGAYLFATFARVPVSYVDFDLYDPDYQRPYGYTCRFEILESPADGYHLDAWRRARQQYEHAAYGALRDTLESIIDGMDQGRGLFPVQDVDATRRLHSMACCYASWAEGDYRGALGHWEDAERPAGVLPSAVEPLAAVWPERVLQLTTTKELPDDVLRLESGGTTDSDSIDLSASLFGKPEIFWLYAQDELTKVDRLIRFTDDFQSALLRAAGLNEVLLKDRVIQVWSDGRIKVKVEVESHGKASPVYGDPLSAQQLTAGQRKAIELRLATFPGAIELAAFLGNKGKPLTLKPLNDETSECASLRLKILRLAEVPALDICTDTFNAQSLARVRNKAAHFTLPVSRSLAEAALDFVGLGVATLAAASAPVPRAMAFTPDWDDLQRACGIEFLPPFDDQPAAETAS